MIIRSAASLILPKPIKRWIRRRIDIITRQTNEPRMIWGYTNWGGEFRPRTRISNTVFMYHRERITIADNVFIWHFTIFDGTGGLEIGEGTQIGAWVGVFTHSSHIAIRIYGRHYQDVPEAEKKGYLISGVKVGNYVFIGAGAKILPGVTVGDGALISAGTVVNSDVGAFEIVAGNPAKAVGDTRTLDEKYLEDPQLRSWYEEWQNKLEIS